MFEYVNTSVPNGLLPGTHGFCGVAMTRDLPEPVRRRLESLSSYTHRVGTNGPEYLRLNPVAWSHLALDGGEHVLGCVRAAPFDYTGRTNRLARFWFFPSGEFPGGMNAAAAIAAGTNAEELSAAWSGEPRWLERRSSSPLPAAPRADARPSAWMQRFGEGDGARLAAAFSVLLAERIRTKGRPLVFLADPAAHGDGTLLLALFADLIALLPTSLRDKATFSTYPVSLPSSTTCHLRGEFGDGARLLAGESAWIDLRAGRAHGSEGAVVPPELLFLATHGYEQPPEPVIRGGRVREPAHSAPAAPAPTPAAAPSGRRPPRTVRGTRPPVGRLISRTAVPSRSKRGFEDYLLYALLGALAIGCVLFVAVFLMPAAPEPLPDSPPPVETTPKPKPKPETPKPKPKPEKPTAPVVTNAPVVKSEPKEVEPPPPPPPPPAPEELNPLLRAQKIKVVKAFSSESVKRSIEDCLWVYYGQDGKKLDFRPVEVKKLGFKNEPKESQIVLLLNKATGTLYWKWADMNPTKLFQSTDEIDLRRRFFGPDDRFFEAWMKGMKREAYFIQSDWNAIPPEEFSGQVLRLEWVAELARKKLDEAQKEAAGKAANLERAQSRLTKKQDEINKLQREYNEVQEKSVKLKDEIESLKNKKNEASSQGRKTEAGKFDQRKNEKEKELNNLPNLWSLGNKLNAAKQDAEYEKSNVKTAERAMADVNRLESLIKDEKQLQARIRASAFTISAVESKK